LGILQSEQGNSYYEKGRLTLIYKLKGHKGLFLLRGFNITIKNANNIIKNISSQINLIDKLLLVIYNFYIIGGGLMRCPFCSYEESKVIDSRPAENGTIVRRRRECIECKRRFTTYEKLEAVPLVVIKKSGERQTFDRSKILSGVLKACEKRPVSADTIENLIDIIEYKILTTYDKEVQSKDIGEIVMEEMRKIDEIAYVRFASVYRQFKDLNTFMDELKIILDENKETKL